jgi:hypothetical protein
MDSGPLNQDKLVNKEFQQRNRGQKIDRKEEGL